MQGELDPPDHDFRKLLGWSLRWDIARRRPVAEEGKMMPRRAKNILVLRNRLKHRRLWRRSGIAPGGLAVRAAAFLTIGLTVQAGQGPRLATRHSLDAFSVAVGSQEVGSYCGLE